MGDYDTTYNLDWYSKRRIATSAGSLLPHIRPGMSLLDCGCGPGSITVDFAEALAPGEVVGIDTSTWGLERAVKEASDRGVKNVRFDEGDIYDLKFADGTFDIVWTSSMVQWLLEPEQALREVFRVLKPGGIYASRDRDRRGDLFGNANPLVQRGLDLHYTENEIEGASLKRGGDLRAMILEAGFERVITSASYENHGDEEGARWTAGFYLRVFHEEGKLSGVRKYNLMDERDMPPLVEAWKTWAEDPKSYYCICRVENVAWKPK